MQFYFIFISLLIYIQCDVRGGGGHFNYNISLLEFGVSINFN